MSPDPHHLLAFGALSLQGGQRPLWGMCHPREEEGQGHSSHQASVAPMAPPSLTCRFVCSSALVRLTEAGTVIRIKSPAPGPRPSRRWGHPLYIRPASPFTPMETQDPDDPERWLLQSSSGRRCKVLTKPATWVCGCVCKGLCAAPRAGLAAASPACGPHVRGELWGLRKQQHVQ